MDPHWCWSAEIGDVDPDPVGHYLPTKTEKRKISCFEMLDVLFL